MASRVLRFCCLSAIAVTALAFALTPAAPASADERGYRAPRMHKPMRHWHKAAPRVRTIYRTRYVERVRPRATWYSEPVAPRVIAEPAYTGCGGCAPAPVVQPVVQPVVEYVHYIQPIVSYRRSYDYAPVYSGCGGCERYIVQQAPGYNYGSDCGGCGRTYAAPYLGEQAWMYQRYGYGYGYGYRYGY